MSAQPSASMTRAPRDMIKQTIERIGSICRLAGVFQLLRKSEPRSCVSTSLVKAMGVLAGKPAGDEDGSRAVGSRPTLNSTDELSADSRSAERRGNDQDDEFGDHAVLLVVATDRRARDADDSAMSLGDEGCTIGLTENRRKAGSHGLRGR